MERKSKAKRNVGIVEKMQFEIANPQQPGTNNSEKVTAGCYL